MRRIPPIMPTYWRWLVPLWPVEFEAVGFDNLDEFQKCTFQAGHATGNSTIAESSPRVLPETVDRSDRQAHIRRTKNGAFRASSRDRSGSGSARTASKYITIASLR